MKKQPIIKERESDIQKAIIGYLQYRGYYVQRMNSGAINAVSKYGVPHLVRLSAPGTPDIMAFRIYKGFTRLLFIEVKRQGGKLTILQQAKINELETYGAECLVAHSVEEVKENGI